MGIFFRANASTRERAFTLFAFAWLGLGLFGVFGLHSGFWPEHLVVIWSVYLALPLSMMFFIPMLLDRHPSNKVRSWGFIKRYSYYLLLLAFCYGLAWTSLALGAPSVVTHFFGQEFAGEYRVIAKGDGRPRWRDRGCDSYSVDVRALDSDRLTSLCSESAWTSVKVGDLLSAKGRHSQFGVMLESFDVRR